jgi:SAM-dependent methyltransferase
VGKDLRLFDAISSSYLTTRRADPQVATAIDAALGHARSVLNVGAGTGNYEPTDRKVIAVEPAIQMIAKRPAGSAPTVNAAAKDLPFPDRSFDASMAVLTVHHWLDWRQGLAEMRRVSTTQVILLFEPKMINQFWAMENNYWPESLALPSEQDAIGAAQVETILDVVKVRTVPIPNDCTDGFGAAFWARPEAYLDPQIQQGMSWLAQLSSEIRAQGSARLAADLAQENGTAGMATSASSTTTTSATG